MIDFLIVAAYMIGVLILGLITGLRVKDLREYSLGNQQFNTFVLVAAMYATLIGGGATMGVAEKVFSAGMVFFVTCTGFVIRDIITAYVAVPRMGQFRDAISVGDIMGSFYGKPGQILTGIAGMLKAIVYVSMQVTAMGYLLYYFLGIPQIVGALCGTGIVIVYSAFGGIRSVTITDVVQFVLLIVAIPVTFSISVGMVGGIQGLFHSAPVEHLQFFPKKAETIRYLSLFLVFMVPDMDPAMVQRMLMGKNVAQVKKALLISAIGRLPYYFLASMMGLVALVLSPGLKADLAFPYLVNAILPIGVKGFAVAGLMAVLMSTADSYLHVAGTLLTHDVINPLRKRPMKDDQELLLTQLLTFVLGVFVLIGALYTTNLMELNIASYALWMPAIFVPLLAGVLGFVTTRRIFLWSALAGISTFAIWKWNLYALTSIDSLLPASVASAGVLFGLHGWKKRKTPEIFERIARMQPIAFLKKLRYNLAMNFNRQFIDKNLAMIGSGILHNSAKKVEAFGAPYGLFGIFAVANFCFVPFILTTTSGRGIPDFIIYIRAISCALSLVLIMRDFWPKKYEKYFPIVWHLTLFFCLPYYAMCTCLFTSCEMQWVVNMVLITFLLGVLVDWGTYVFLLFMGMVCGWMSFYYFGEVDNFSIGMENFPFMAYAVCFAFIVGVVFSRNRERVILDKVIAFKALSSTIAHEMRTPLSSINVSANGLQRCLPALVEGYLRAEKEGQISSKLAPYTLGLIQSIPQHLSYVCGSTLNTIDMLLLQLQDADWSEYFTKCSMRDCVQAAMDEYTFRENERPLIKYDRVGNFEFYGHKHLTMHVIFNLLRNALAYINSEGHGTIEMWTVKRGNYNELHFRDTAKGIKKSDLSRIFDHDFSRRNHGTGVGLYFCQRAIRKMSGIISCESEEGVYAEFILEFPEYQGQATK